MEQIHIVFHEGHEHSSVLGVFSDRDEAEGYRAEMDALLREDWAERHPDWGSEPIDLIALRTLAVDAPRDTLPGQREVFINEAGDPVEAGLWVASIPPFRCQVLADGWENGARHGGVGVSEEDALRNARLCRDVPLNPDGGTSPD